MRYKSVSTNRQNISQNVTRSRVLKTSEVEPADSFLIFYFISKVPERTTATKYLKSVGEREGLSSYVGIVTQFALR
jgi:hypothetical protein